MNNTFVFCLCPVTRTQALKMSNMKKSTFKKEKRKMKKKQQKMGTESVESTKEIRKQEMGFSSVWCSSYETHTHTG